MNSKPISPDADTVLYPIFEDIVKSHGYVIGSKTKGYVRFTSKKLAEYLPKGDSKSGNTWKHKELFLFEFVFRHKQNPKSISLKAVIGPGNEKIAQKIMDAVRESEFYNWKRHEVWCTFYRKLFPIPPKELANKNTEKIRSELEALITEAKPDIDGVIRLIEAQF